MVGPLNIVNARPVYFQNLCNDFCLQLKNNLPQQFCQDFIFLNDYVINNFYNFMTMLLCGQLVLNPSSYLVKLNRKMLLMVQYWYFQKWFLFLVSLF
jgi:hypothetical protein